MLTTNYHWNLYLSFELLCWHMWSRCLMLKLAEVPGFARGHRASRWQLTPVVRCASVVWCEAKWQSNLLWTELIFLEFIFSCLHAFAWLEKDITMQRVLFWLHLLTAFTICSVLKKWAYAKTSIWQQYVTICLYYFCYEFLTLIFFKNPFKLLINVVNIGNC